MITITQISLAQDTWYSYQTGDWDNPTTWTLDGSTAPIYDNPSSEIPDALDKIVITSGRAVSILTNSKTVTEATVVGILDIGTSNSHNFTNIIGPGIIRIAGSSGAGNFPAGNTTDFGDPDNGGTVEAYGGTSFNLDITSTVNNISILMNVGVALVINDNLDVNGNITVTQGVFQINDAGTTNLTLQVDGNITVETSGEINTGTGNARHQLNIDGSIINNGGDINFSNLGGPDYTTTPLDGIVDVNFTNLLSDQLIVANGISNFYRIEVDKGDATKYLFITSNSDTNFGLFGTANEDHNTSTTQLVTNNNALGLLTGTISLGTNVSIPQLSVANNYVLSEGSAIEVNGGTLSKTTGTSLTVFGNVLITEGSLNISVSDGVVLKNSGSFSASGGSSTLNQLYSLSDGAVQGQSFEISGGSVLIDAENPNTSYKAFDLQYSTNVFNIAGGTLTVESGNQTASSGIRIKSDPDFNSATGGTIISEIEIDEDYDIDINCDVWNLILRTQVTSAISKKFFLSDDIKALNDINVESGPFFPIFDPGTFAISVGRELEIEGGASFIADAADIIFIGSLDGILDFDNPSLTQGVNNIVVRKDDPNATVDFINGYTFADAMIIQGEFRIESGNFEFGDLDITSWGDLYIADTLGEIGGTGIYTLGDPFTNLQSITSVSGAIYNFEVDNTGGISLDGNISILNELSMSAGVFDINSSKLTIEDGASITNSSNPAISYSSTFMIQTNGRSSDGGLEFFLDDALNNTDVLYPFGTDFDKDGVGKSTRYTPATINLSSLPASGGYLRISLADGAPSFLKPAQASQSTSFSWRVRYRDFASTPTVERYDFLTNSEDCANNNPTDDLKGWASIRVVGGTRSSEGSNYGNGDFLIQFGTPGDGAFTIEDGSYLAGKSSAINGSITTYYTFRDNDSNLFTWDDGAGWSTNPLIYVNSGGNKFPEQGDIAVIQSDGTNWHRVATIDGLDVVEVRFDNSIPAGDNLPQIDILSSHTVILNEVSGEGHVKIRVDPGGAQILPDITGDIEDLASQANTIFEFNSTEESVYDNGSTGVSGTPTSIPLAAPTGTPVDLINALDPPITSYTNLWLRANADASVGSYPFTFSSDITANELLIDDGGFLITNNGTNGDITVNGNLVVGDGSRAGLIEFHGGSDSRTITVTGDLIFDVNSDLNVEDITGTAEHRLTVSQNISLSSSSVFSTRNNSFDNVFVELAAEGIGNHSFSNANTTPLDLYRVIMNKGTDTTSVFTIDSDFTLSANPMAAQVVDKPIVLNNGLLKLNAPTTNEDIVTGGAEFEIPSSSGLDLVSGTLNFSGASTGIRLDGLLRLTSGAIDMINGNILSDAYIRYSNTGSAKLEILSGTLDIASALRRDVNVISGVLTYIQKGGTVNVGKNLVSAGNRGTFEVTGSGGSFSYTGGAINVIRGNSSLIVPSILITTGTSNVSQAIAIDPDYTPADGFEQNVGIYSTIELEGIDIQNNNVPNAEALIYIDNLALNGSLTIASGTTFDTNSRNLTIGGDLDDNGTFTHVSGEVLFNSPTTQQITGSSPTEFFSLLKAGAGTLSLTKDITVNGNLNILSGILDDADNTITVFKDVLNRSVHLSTGYSGSSEGIKLNGSSQQLLEGITSGTAVFGTLTIDNTANVVVPVNGYNIDVTNRLNLINGIFNIGGSLLTLKTGADISGTFGASTFVSTNSSFTDNGVRKEFAIGTVSDFTFPVGELYYTPVLVSFSLGTSGTTEGSILVRPAREAHPSVNTDDCPTVTPGGTSINCDTDRDNVLQYYWVLDADNLTGASGIFTFNYDQNSVSLGTDQVGTPFTEGDYVGARYLFNDVTNSIFKPLGTLNSSTNTLSVPFTGDDGAFSGDYFAGVETSLPNNIASYETTGTGGNVDVPATFTPVPPGIPLGSIITVKSGDELVLNVSAISFYSIEIESGATLTVADGTLFHRIGNVSGEGTLKLVSNSSSVVLPAGFYNDFFGCSGGILEYAGTGSYSIMGSISQVRSLRISDSGTKTLPSNDITICEDFEITGGDVVHSATINFSIGSNILISGGSYTHNGTLNAGGNLDLTGGSFSGGTSGDKTIVGNLNINGGSFAAGSGGVSNIGGNISLLSGTFNGGSNTSEIQLNGSSSQTITGTFTGGSGFFNLNINNVSGVVLAGNVDVTNQLDLTNGVISPSGNDFTLDTDAVIGIGVDSRRRGNVGSYVNGKMIKNFSAAELTATTSTPFIFPVGGSGRWKYASLGSVSGSNNWSVEFIQGDVTTETEVDNLTIDPMSTVLTIQDSEYWIIDDNQSPGSGQASVGLSWDDLSGVSAVTEERERLVAMWWDDGNSYWGTKGGQSFSAGHIQTQGDFESTDATTFSKQFFTLGSTDPNNPLPITLIEFEGSYIASKGVILDWTTAIEIDNEYFEVLHSTNGEQWVTLGRISGAGNSANSISYQYIHKSPDRGNNYYKLRQVDFNGDFSFTKIINVNVDIPDVKELDILVYPNPVSGTEFSVDLKLIDENSPYELRIMDSRGTNVGIREFLATGFEETIKVQKPDQNGLYYIHLIQGDFFKTTKVIVID